MRWVWALCGLVASVLLAGVSAKQESILSPSAENDLRRTPINLNPYLRRSLLRALYHLEAEYQQQQALEAGRALAGGVPVIGEYHRSAPPVLKDPALRRALLRVLIHLEAEDLDKRAREAEINQNAKEKAALKDAQQQNAFLKSYMDENFPDNQQQPGLAHMDEYVKFANQVNGSGDSGLGSATAAGTQVNTYAQPQEQTTTPAVSNDQQYNGHQLPYDQQQQQQHEQQQQQQQQQQHEQQQYNNQQQYNQQGDQNQQQYNQQDQLGQQQYNQQNQQQYNQNDQQQQQQQQEPLQQPNLELQTALPSQNYGDQRLALNFQTDYTTANPYVTNHNYNATTEFPMTTDYYQTANPTDDYPTTASPASGSSNEASRQVDGFFFQSPDPVEDGRDNSITSNKDSSQRSISSSNANTLPTAETPADTTALSTHDTTLESTTLKPTVTTEDIKIFQAPLLAAFTLHQDAHGTPQRIVPLYRKSSKVDDDQEQELKQQQELLEQQLRRLQELQAKQQQLLKLQQFLTQEQERQRQIKKAQLAKASSPVAVKATAPTPVQTTLTAQTPTAHTTQVTQSTTPEAAVQIHHSQGDPERQKQIEEYDKQRQVEIERARKQAILEALERERQQKLIEAENARQRQLQQFYEEQHRQRLAELERQRLAALDLTFQRSVEFNAQPSAVAPAVPPAAPSAPREPSEEQRLTYRSFQQEPPPLPNTFNTFSTFPQTAPPAPPQTATFQGSFQQNPITASQNTFNTFQSFPPFQPPPQNQPTIQPSIQVSQQSFQAVGQVPQGQQSSSRPHRHEPFGSTGNFGFNNFEQSRNLFFNSQQAQQSHNQRQRGLDGQLQTLLHQSGISAPQEDLNIVSKVLALNPERPDQLVGLF